MTLSSRRPALRRLTSPGDYRNARRCENGAYVRGGSLLACILPVMALMSARFRGISDILYSQPKLLPY